MRNVFLTILATIVAVSSFGQYTFEKSIVNPNGTVINYITPYNGEVFFQAEDPNLGYELFKYNLQTKESSLVKDILPGFGSSSPAFLFVFKNHLYFSAYTTLNGRELWRSDGTDSGTVLLKEFNPGTANGFPAQFQIMDSFFVFTATDSLGSELWISDGTTNGTSLLKDIRTGASGSNSSVLGRIGDVVFFNANDGTNGVELWKTNGTFAGTSMVKDIDTTGNSNPVLFASLGNSFLFIAYTQQLGYELWKSDGTEQGTNLVLDITPGNGSTSFYEIYASNGKVYLSIDALGYGIEPWISDGTAGGTELLKDILLFGSSSYPQDFVSYNGKTYFHAYETTNGRELWETQGTTSSTKLSFDIKAGNQSSNIQIGTLFDGHLFFGADENQNNNDRHLFFKNGDNDPVRIAPPNAPVVNPYPTGMTEAYGKLFFYAKYTSHGNQLWIVSPDTTTGIDDHKLTGLSIFPNPTSELLHVDIDNNENYTFFIVDIEGRVLKEVKGREIQNGINVQFLSTGTYLLWAIKDDIMHVNQFIKK